MSSIHESQYVVNSFHAVDAATKSVIECDERGFINPAAGTEIIFESPVIPGKYIEISSIHFTNGKDANTKIAINDNEMYPFGLDKGESRGIEYIYAYKIKFLEGGPFYYEGLGSRM